MYQVLLGKSHTMEQTVVRNSTYYGTDCCSESHILWNRLLLGTPHTMEQLLFGRSHTMEQTVVRKATYYGTVVSKATYWNGLLFGKSHTMEQTVVNKATYFGTDCC